MHYQADRERFAPTDLVSVERVIESLEPANHRLHRASSAGAGRSLFRHLCRIIALPRQAR